MGYRFLGIVTVLVLLALNTSGASAKPPRYIITGGELGAYAALIEPVEGDPFSVQLPGQDSRATVAPAHTPGLVYKVWQPFGYLDLVPVLDYYPESGLIRMEWSGDWYQAGRSTVALLKDVLDHALQKKAAGELEDSVIRAQLRDKHFPEASFLLRLYAAPGEGYNVQGSRECMRCTLLSGPIETFVMVHLAEVLEGPLVGPAPQVPPYAIEFEVLEPPSGRVTGLLGMYRPPELGRPGQFWLEHYSRDILYRETTPGFDAVIAEALERNQWDTAPSGRAHIDPESGGKVWLWLWIGGMVVAALCVGSAIIYGRSTAK
ncbi:MAG: hypothetical protein IIB22_02735 [Chloroflexi bacterium]|nr:hypothetical protein [Chloroflexota bacterium]